MYEHVDDIDLFVGASMEKDLDGSILGPTFQCIVGEQFYRTRVGDSHFYDVADMPYSFTPGNSPNPQFCKLHSLYASLI
jgi:peroxidase